MHAAAMARFERPLLGGPIGLPGRPQQLGPGPFGFGYGLGQQRFASLGLAGFGHHGHQGKLPPMQVHPYLGYGLRPVIDMGLVILKTEPKVEPVVEGGSDESLAYQQLMSQLPLGPQM